CSTWIVGGARVLRRTGIFSRTGILGRAGILRGARIGGLGCTGVLRGARVRLLREGGAGAAEAEDSGDHERCDGRSHHDCHLLSLAGSLLPTRWPPGLFQSATRSSGEYISGRRCCRLDGGVVRRCGRSSWANVGNALGGLSALAVNSVIATAAI